MKPLLLIASHLLTLVIGFAGGVYVLPILIAPEAPTQQAIEANNPTALWTATFRRDLKDSDALHWGEGAVSIGPQTISLVPPWHRTPPFLCARPASLWTRKVWHSL